MVVKCKIVGIHGYFYRRQKFIGYRQQWITQIFMKQCNYLNINIWLLKDLSGNPMLSAHMLRGKCLTILDHILSWVFHLNYWPIWSQQWGLVMGRCRLIPWPILCLFSFKRELITSNVVQSTWGQRSKWSISEVFLHILVRDP